MLPEDRIQAAFDEQGVTFAQEEDEVNTPPITMWALLSQVLFKEEQQSCVAAVSRAVVLLAALGKQPPSGNAGADCRARAKLSVSVIRSRSGPPLRAAPPHRAVRAAFPHTALTSGVLGVIGVVAMRD